MLVGASTRRRATRGGAAHWDAIYRENPDEDLSWHQATPDLSLRLIREFAGKDRRILDVGGGSSALATDLARDGFQHVTVLDISPSALDRNRAKAAAYAGHIRYVPGDVRDLAGVGPVDVWHDRAVLHFFTQPDDQRRYVDRVRSMVAPGGIVILATFALDGPERCSGLPVKRYDEGGMCKLLGPEFTLLRAVREIHRTPWGVEQPFLYAVFERTKPPETS